MRDLQKDREQLFEKTLVADYVPDSNDCAFIIEARKGWPETIKRAMAAEARVKDLEKELDEITDIRNKILNYWAEKLGYECTNELAYPALGDRRAKPVPVLEQIKELEAQCAAMREALEIALINWRSYAADIREYDEAIDVADDGEALEYQKCEQVLSNDAGNTLLERIAKLEAVVEAAKDYVQAIDDIWAGRYDLSTVPEGEMLPEEIHLRKALAELEGDKDE